MPHYKDGTEAKVGDLIKGTGYNIKDASGKQAVIVGTLVQITPKEESCNLIVLTTKVTKLDKDDPTLIYRAREAHSFLSTYPGGVVDPENQGREYYALNAVQEYGAIKDFELIHRPE